MQQVQPKKAKKKKKRGKKRLKKKKTECLLHDRHYTRCWEYKADQNITILNFMEFIFQ